MPDDEDLEEAREGAGEGKGALRLSFLSIVRRGQFGDTGDNFKVGLHSSLGLGYGLASGPLQYAVGGRGSAPLAVAIPGRKLPAFLASCTAASAGSPVDGFTAVFRV